MFRKLTHTLLSLLLLMSTLGLTFSRHYCGQELVAIQWFIFDNESTEDACCPKEDNDCCNDEFVQINPVQTEVTIQVVQQIVPNVSVELSEKGNFVIDELYQHIKLSAPNVSEQPPPNLFDIGLVNCCFLI